MEGKSKILPGLKDQLEQAHVKRRKLADAEAALRQKDIAVQEAQKQVSYLESERVRLDKEIGETGEKLDLIASHVAAHTEARCPLCDQELTREALALIQSKYAQEKEEKTDAVIVNGENLSHKRAEFEALSREKVEMESGLNQEKTRLQSQEDLLKSKIKEIEENNLKIAELRGALNDIEQRLARREFAAAEQQALGAIENELTALGYNEAEREAAQKKFKELQNYEREKNSLDEALRLIGREKEAAAKVQQEAQSKREGLAQDNLKKQSLSAELVNLPTARQELAAAEAAAKELSAQGSRAQEALGIIKAQLQRLGELELKKKKRRRSRPFRRRKGAFTATWQRRSVKRAYRRF